MKMKELLGNDETGTSSLADLGNPSKIKHEMISKALGKSGINETQRHPITTMITTKEVSIFELERFE